MFWANGLNCFNPSQGEAILIHTIDGKSILIDGGLDATSLAQELDSRLPFWQRSIDTVILTSPRQDHLIGAQDVISRFQVGQILDAGMLHPSTGYALWKHTIIDRNLPYSQVREGSYIQMGTQASIQVLWPPRVLHKGSHEELDNALIARLVAPHFSMLLLGSAALSNYALSGLLTIIDPGYLKANVVQVVGEAGKAFPTELTRILQVTLPSPTRGRASGHHQRGGLFPGEPRLKRVVEPLTDPDNVGACLPDYSFSWS